MKKAFIDKWFSGPAIWFALAAVLVFVWAVMDPAALVRAFDQDGYSPFELATLPFFAAIVPLVWWKCPFSGAKSRRTILCLAVSLVAVMAIVKEMDLHNMALHALCPDYIGEDGKIIPGVLFKPNGSPLTGTPFKARFLTNGAVPLGAKAFVLLYFGAFFGVFAAGLLYFAVPFVKGVFALDAAAWTFGCFGAVRKSYENAGGACVPPRRKGAFYHAKNTESAGPFPQPDPPGPPDGDAVPHERLPDAGHRAGL